MKFLLNVVMPHEPFNTLMKHGKVGKILGKIQDELKPEAVYFTEQDGKRTGLYIINIEKASDIPKVAEPFFLNFNAACNIRIVMTPDDLMKSGIDKLGEKWG
jgi:hypothetical protein